MILMAKEAAKSASTKLAAKSETSKKSDTAKKDAAKKKPSAGKKFTQFFKDLKSEIKKVVWPTKKQVKNNTIVVLIFMAVAAVFIWGIDFILSALMKLIFN